MPQCKKLPYENKDLALKAMVEMNTIHARKQKAAYKCPFCFMYHLTTQSKKRSRKTDRWIKKNQEKFLNQFK